MESNSSVLLKDVHPMLRGFSTTVIVIEKGKVLAFPGLPVLIIVTLVCNVDEQILSRI